jgi:hypothetical protein
MSFLFPRRSSHCSTSVRSSSIDDENEAKTTPLI